MTSVPPLLAASAVSPQFGSATVLSTVDLDVRAELLALVSPNGGMARSPS